MKKILVFTDLDGTLLNHYNYSWRDAVPALTELNEKAFPVVFTSSKTSAEIMQLKRKMENYHPFISENGAIANIPEQYFENNQTENNIDQYQATYFTKSYQDIINTLNKYRNEFQFNFRGFNDMEIDDLIALTDLSVQQAINAKQRQASEPFLWKGSESEFTKFKEHLTEEDLIVTSGGRFFHVMSNVHKGQTIQWLINKYQVANPEVEWVTIGLGDSYNDIQMLETVDYSVFINNPGTTQPDLSSIDNLFKTQLPGPAGWNKAIFELLHKII